MFKLDLFNKKEIKELEQEVYNLNNDIEGYIKNERNWSKQIDNMEKISTKTIFWIIWIIAIGLIDFGYVSLDNYYLED